MRFLLFSTIFYYFYYMYNFLLLFSTIRECKRSSGCPLSDNGSLDALDLFSNSKILIWSICFFFTGPDKGEEIKKLANVLDKANMNQIYFRFWSTEISFQHINFSCSLLQLICSPHRVVRITSFSSFEIKRHCSSRRAVRQFHSTWFAKYWKMKSLLYSSWWFCLRDAQRALSS